jgi:hypothetical protein|tara:strand:- start:783 stop:1172 length:390 start_codon:yes stop_codon:yes gene_type:complete
MLHSCVEDKIAFYNQTRFVENPNHPNGFNGTFAFTSVSKIPEVFHAFLQRHFGQYRIRRLPVDKINELLNELWEGPGSLEKIFLLEKELMLSGKDVKFTAADLAIMKSKKAEEEDEEKAIAEIREDNRT